MVSISDADRENFQRDGFLKVETWHKGKTTDGDCCCRHVDYCLYLFGMLVYCTAVVLHMISLYYDCVARGREKRYLYDMIPCELLVDI